MIEFSFEKTLTSGRPFHLTVQTHVPKGAFLGIAGRSGSGKTTLLRLLAGLMVPDAGFFRHGESVWVDRSRRVFVPARKRPVGFVFQDGSLFPHWTVLQNLLYACNDRGRAKDLLELTRMTAWKDSYPHEISGGQAQRACLARALMRGPELLLLDEPFSALDEDLRETLGAEVAAIQQETKIATIMVTHSRRELDRYCTDVLRLDDGRVVDGEPTTAQ